MKEFFKNEESIHTPSPQKEINKKKLNIQSIKTYLLSNITQRSLQRGAMKYKLT